MSIHKELAFEEEICEHLGSHGWIYVEGDSSRYDRALALFPDDVLAWVQGTQPQAWEALVKNHGAKAGETLLHRLRDSINQRGTLDVLRQGIEMLGVKGKLPLAQFKPALALNPEIQARYQANRLRVVRQVRYSQVSAHHRHPLTAGVGPERAHEKSRRRRPTGIQRGAWPASPT